MDLIVFGIHEKNRDKKLHNNEKILIISKDPLEIINFLIQMGFNFPGAKEKCVVSLRPMKKITAGEIRPIF